VFCPLRCGFVVFDEQLLIYQRSKFAAAEDVDKYSTPPMEQKEDMRVHLPDASSIQGDVSQ
jgi:hypothetical protein